MVQRTFTEPTWDTFRGKSDLKMFVALPNQEPESTEHILQ